jgi:hypothetical protein
MKNLDARIQKMENQVLLDAIVPPAELVPYLKEQKNMPVDPEAARAVNLMYKKWVEAFLTAMQRNVIDPRKIMDLFPEPFRSKVIEAIERQLGILDGNPIEKRVVNGQV